MPDTDGPGHAVDWSTWDAPLRRFADASGMVISVLDATGTRRVGPFAGGPLGTLLAGSRLFDPDRGNALEQQLLDRVGGGTSAAASFDGVLRIHALPVVRANQVVGAVVFGWVLADFASSLACDRLAAASGVASADLWRAARLEGPFSAARMATNGALLEAMVGWGAQLIEAKSQLERLAVARDAFLARVSHDLRTPLNAIALRVGLLAQTADDPAAVRTHAGALQRTVGEGARLVEDLVEAAVSRSGGFTLVMAPTDMVDVINRAYESVAPAAEARSIQLVLDVPPEPVAVVADAGRLRQAVWNVMANAVKFSPGGGRVVVALTTSDRAISLRVSDHGPGIAADLVDRIFEPFVRGAAGNGQGLGLGLAIARQIIESHGGTIRVAPTERGAGSTFVLELPTGAATALRPLRAPEP